MCLSALPVPPSLGLRLSGRGKGFIFSHYYDLFSKCRIERPSVITLRLKKSLTYFVIFEFDSFDVHICTSEYASFFSRPTTRKSEYIRSSKWHKSYRRTFFLVCKLSCISNQQEQG